MYYASTVQACGVYPFATGTARPVSGAPLGVDLLTGTAVAMDHHQLYMEGVISSPSMFLLGLNGVGKSTTAQLMVLGQMGRGMVPAIFNPLKKGEHSPLVAKAGGVVYEFGPASKHRMNLLSDGPLGKAANQIGGEVGAELRRLAITKSVQSARLALSVSRGEALSDIEDTIVQTMVEDIKAREKQPVSMHLAQMFTNPSERVMAHSGQKTVDGFHERFTRLGESLVSMLYGDLGALLGGTDSIEIDPGNRGGFCFDTSDIPASDTRLLSTAMLMSWSLGMDAIDAHWELARHEAAIAAEAAAAGEFYTPKVVWTGYTSIMDEFWYPMRAARGIVDRVDAASRTNRSTGWAEMKISHSPKDMLSLPDVDDREKARGLIERSGLMAMMALTREDATELSRIKPMTQQEISTITGFNAAQSWGTRPTTSTANQAPPGAGKVMFKVEGRPGIPVQMTQTKTQQSLHVMDMRFRTQNATTRARRTA